MAPATTAAAPATNAREAARRGGGRPAGARSGGRGRRFSRGGRGHTRRRRGDRGARRAQRLPRARRPLSGLLGQHPPQHVVERVREARAGVGRRRRRLEAMRPQRRDLGVARERDAAGERLEQHAAERIDVGGGRRGRAVQQLGRDVVDGADPAAGRRAGVARGQVLAGAEVRQPRVIAVEQDVRGLDVAMDDAALMSGVQCRRHLLEQLDRDPRLEACRAPQALSQIAARDPAHAQVEVAVDLSRLVDRDHIRVLERGHQPPLALEARDERPVGGERGGDQLQRDRALEPEVRGLIDDAHPAAPRLGLDAMTRERPADARLRARGH